MNSLISKHLLSLIINQIRRHVPHGLHFIYLEEIVELFLVSFLTKNLNLFVRWLKKQLEKKTLKQHKQVFSFLYLMLYSVI